MLLDDEEEDGLLDELELEGVELDELDVGGGGVLEELDVGATLEELDVGGVLWELERLEELEAGGGRELEELAGGGGVELEDELEEEDMAGKMI